MTKVDAGLLIILDIPTAGKHKFRLFIETDQSLFSSS